MDIDFPARRRRVLDALEAHNTTHNSSAAALLVTDMRNIRYLTGFTGSAGVLLLCADGAAHLASDSRYTEQLKTEVGSEVQVYITRSYTTTVISEAIGEHGAELGFEDSALSFTQWRELRNEFGALSHAVNLVPTNGLVEQARRVKDDAEIAALARACEITTNAWTALLAAGQLAAGRTEREVAADLEWHMRSFGSDGVSFDTIVASGPNGALPHHHAGDRKLRAGDLVVVDFGCYRDGYASDCTRSVSIGAAAGWAAEIYALTLAAHLAGESAAVAGARAADVDAAARSIIADGGYGEAFGHSLGHGVGMDVHEAPAVSQTSTSTLLRGDVVTVEPGIYLPGRGGVRIEDTLVVTDGAPRILTTSAKELLEL